MKKIQIESDISYIYREREYIYWKKRMLTYIAIVEGANMKIIWFLRFKLFAVDGRLSRRDVARTELPPDHDKIKTLRNN